MCITYKAVAICLRQVNFNYIRPRPLVLLSVVYLCASSFEMFLNATTATQIVVNATSSPSSSSIGDAYRIIVSVLFSVILVGGLTGNVLVIFIVLRWKDMKTPCNYLIMNIAIADLAVAVIAAPLRIIELYLGWPFGSFMCHFLVPLQDLFVCVSAVTYTAIALERYRAIVKPTKPRISPRKTKIAITSSWIICYITACLPVALIVGLRMHSGRVYCDIFWPSDLFRRVYEIFLVTFFIVIPLSIQSWAYVSMRRTLSLNLFHRFHSCRGTPKEQCQRKSVNTKKKIRLIRVLFILVISFQVCYIPRGLIMLLREFGYFPQSLSFLYLNMGALILYYLRHVLNPIILFITSSGFRAHWKEIKCAGYKRKTYKSHHSIKRSPCEDNLYGVKRRIRFTRKKEEVNKLDIVVEKRPKRKLSMRKLESTV